MLMTPVLQQSDTSENALMQISRVFKPLTDGVPINQHLKTVA